MSLYNLKSFDGHTFTIAKFDTDFNVEAIYNLVPVTKGQGFSCDCPANNRSVILKPCKHRRMLPLMLGAVNTDRFYDPETGGWCQPLGDLLRPEAGDLAEREALPDLTEPTKALSRLAGEALRVEGEAPTIIDEASDVTQAMWDTGLVGEAPGSPADVEPTYVVPESSPNLAEFKALVATGAIKLAVQGPIPASQAPTIRRR